MMAANPYHIKCRPQIEKIRHVIKDDANKVVWELDEFFGDNQGLIVAEVELASESQVRWRHPRC
jgi:adenylate cyclase